MLNEDASKLIFCHAIHSFSEEANLRSSRNQIKRRKDSLKRTGTIPLKKTKCTGTTDLEDSEQVLVVLTIDPDPLLPLKGRLVRAFDAFDGKFCSVPRDLDTIRDTAYFGLDCEFV